jgi:hypothetical protein
MAQGSTSRRPVPMKLPAILAKAEFAVVDPLQRGEHRPPASDTARLQPLGHGLSLQRVHPAEPPDRLLIERDRAAVGPCGVRSGQTFGGFSFEKRTIAGLELCVGRIGHGSTGAALARDDKAVRACHSRGT